MCLLQIKIGNADYNCSCVRYVTSPDHVTSTDQVTSADSDHVTSADTDHQTSTDHSLIIGVAVGLGLPLIIIIIIIVIVVVVRRRRRSKACNNNGAGSVELCEDSENYDTIPAAETDNDNRYSTLGAVGQDEHKYAAIHVEQPKPATGDTSPCLLYTSPSPRDS